MPTTLPKILKQLPLERRGYSDRIAAFLAKLSKLAYIKFEQVDKEYASYVLNALEKLDKDEGQKVLLDFLKPKKITAFSQNREKLRAELEALDMDLVEDFDEGSTHTQAFIAKVGTGKKDHPLGEKVAVLSFRGSEMLMHDWATNFSIGDVRMICGAHQFQIHQGFLKAFKSVQKSIEESLQKLTDEGYVFYITGHSLGGALALVATHQLGRKKIDYMAVHDFPEKKDYPEASALVGEKIAGCYSFGAPRVAGIGFAQSIKSPYYRIVHADDPVPRVPPVYLPSLLLIWQKPLSYVPALRSLLPVVFRSGALIVSLIGKLVKKKIGVSIALTADVLSVASQFVHHGDMRYIRRKVEGQPLILISNPDLLVRLKEFCKHGFNQKAKIVKDHAIAVYCDLLELYSEQRSGKNQ